MIDGNRYFELNGTVGTVPSKNVDAFLKEYPNAIEQGKFILPDKQEGYIPFENVDAFMGENPKAQVDNDTYNNYTGWVQGKNTEQELYSGLKEAPIPAAPNMVIMPGKAWEPSKEEPLLPVPTAEESQAANVKYKAEQEARRINAEKNRPSPILPTSM